MRIALTATTRVKMKMTIDRLLRGLEISLLQPAFRKSAQAPALLADEFIEFGSSGRVFTKARIVGAMRAAAPVKVTATHVKVRRLTRGVALVTYRAHRHSEPPVDSRRSSLWVQRQGRWQMLFHQGTLIPPPP